MPRDDFSNNNRFDLVSAPRYVAFAWAQGGWRAVGSSDVLAEAEHYAATRGAHGCVRERGQGEPPTLPAIDPDERRNGTHPARWRRG